jgi:uncharacterized membrane protein YqjE
MVAGGSSDAGPVPADAPAGGPTAPTRQPGLRDALGAAATTLASAVQTRLELASLEFVEERERAKRRLALVLVVAIAAGFALLAGNALFVLATWERLGLYSLVILLAVYVAVAGLGMWRLATIGRRERRPFDVTLSELERDRAWLAGRLGERP